MTGSFDPYDWASFYFGPMSRDEANRLLSSPDVSVGTFLLRDSSHSGEYSLSVRESDDDVENKVRHYLIRVENEGGASCVRIAEQSFVDIPMLLNHFKMRILDKTSLTMPYRKNEIERVIGLYRFDGEREVDLPFEAGEELEIIGKSDAEWWQARNALNSTGLIPANYVAPINEERQIKGHSQSSYGSIGTEDRFSGISGTGSDSSEPRYEPTLPAKAKAILDRQPNAYDATQLRLKKGDTVLVTKKCMNGQYEASLNGRTGLVPFTYIRFQPPATAPS